MCLYNHDYLNKYKSDISYFCLFSVFSLYICTLYILFMYRHLSLYFFYMVHLCISLTDLFLPPVVPLFLSLGPLVMEIFRIKIRLLNPYNCILSVLFSTPFKCRKPHAQIINFNCCLLNVRVKNMVGDTAEQGGGGT